MTAKRFTLEEFGLNFIVNDNGRNLTAKQTVDRLNELHEENKELKADNKRLVKFILSKGYGLKDYLDWLQKEVWK